MSRIAAKFAELKKANRAAFVPFVTAGDPDLEASFEIISRLPAAGADVIELGIPFSDPMADGPTNQASYLRALKAGMTLAKILEMVRRFRKSDKATPIVLMGAYNPIHAFGTALFMKAAAEAGVDGLLIVDVPAEEDEVLRLPAAAHGIDIVRFLAPTTDAARLKVVLQGATGYLYYAPSPASPAPRAMTAAVRRRSPASMPRRVSASASSVLASRPGTGGRHRSLRGRGRGRLRDCGENRVARSPGFKTCRNGGRCDRIAPHWPNPYAAAGILWRLTP